MSLGQNSVAQEAIGTDGIYVRALLNDGWRWSAPGNPQVVHWAVDAAWTPLEVQTLSNIFANWGNVSNITFVQVTNPNDAEIFLQQTVGANIGGFGGYSGTPGETTPPPTPPVIFDDVTIAQLGRVGTYVATDGFLIAGQNTFIPNPDTSDTANPFVISNAGVELITHEIGHALGLKHPFDGGAEGTPDRFPGVAGQNDLGNNGLNQSLYTLMTYNHWQDANPAPGALTATMATPMAFDIAAIQRLYGANTTFHNGNDTYMLPDPGSGPTWRAIWDTDGTDEIVYNGSANAVIDLRPATLDDSPTGGGVPSYTFIDNSDATRNYGHGFTIAGDYTNALADRDGVTGVIIENASGGSGNDDITGNGTDNVLRGNAGDDTLRGLGGDDYLDGGDNSDTASFAVNKADFAIVGSATDLTIADRTPGRYGTDRALNVETFIFLDGTFTAEEIANAAPIITSNGGNNLAVLAAENTYFVTKVVATDPDADPLTFALSGADAALFQVAANGDITFLTAPDFEAPVGGDNVYDLAVTVTDTSFATDTQAITVTVTDVVEIVDTDTVALLSGTAGADTITPGAGQDTVLAGDGNDVIKATINDGKDVYNGGNGSDTVDYSALTAGVTVKLGQNGGPGSGFGIQVGEDKLISIENAIGSAAADQITGNEVGNVLEGGRGNDLMTGFDGNDSYTFRSGFGLDRIFDFDDAGDDTIVFSTAVFTDWTAVQNAMSASDADVVITLDAANSITLLGTTLASMTQTDFLFVP